MKKMFFITVLFSICSFSYANSYEFLFCAKQDNSFIPTSVTIYRYNYGGYNLIGSGSTLTTSVTLYNNTSWNGLAYVDGVSGMDKSPTILPTNRTDSLIDSVDTYLIKVENLYAIIQPNPSGFDAQIYYTVTNNLPSLYVSTAGNVIAQNLSWSPKTIYLRNDFGGDRDFVSGTVYLNGESITAGYNYVGRERQAEDFPLEIFGLEVQYLSGNSGYYYRTWRKWAGYPNNSRIQSLNYENDYYQTATYARQCNVTIQNDFGAAGTGGTIKFNNSTQNSPYQPTSPVYEDINSTVEGVSQSVSRVDFTFDHWEFQSSNIGSSNPKSDFKPTSHGTLKAKFTGKPNNYYRNLSFNTNEENEPIRITWSKHPLDGSDITQYALFRRVTKFGTPTLLTTITANGSNTYTYTDNEFAINSSDDKILLFYDVRAYYEPSATESDVDFAAVYGVSYASITINNNLQCFSIVDIPTEYSISNYPNPFNPTTTINYQLPQDGFVTIKVYDMLGKEIATLVDGSRTAGYHNVNFDASRLTSGIYVYTINAGNYIQSKKMLMIK